MFNKKVVGIVIKENLDMINNKKKKWKTEKMLKMIEERRTLKNIEKRYRWLKMYQKTNKKGNTQCKRKVQCKINVWKFKFYKIKSYVTVYIQS